MSLRGAVQRVPRFVSERLKTVTRPRPALRRRRLRLTVRTNCGAWSSSASSSCSLRQRWPRNTAWIRTAVRISLRFLHFLRAQRPRCAAWILTAAASSDSTPHRTPSSLWSLWSSLWPGDEASAPGSGAETPRASWPWSPAHPATEVSSSEGRHRPRAGLRSRTSLVLSGRLLCEPSVMGNAPESGRLADSSPQAPTARKAVQAVEESRTVQAEPRVAHGLEQLVDAREVHPGRAQGRRSVTLHPRQPSGQRRGVKGDASATSRRDRG